jgi:hypothetical protein
MRLPAPADCPAMAGLPPLSPTSGWDAGAWRFHGAPRALRLLQHYQYGWMPPAIAPSAVVETAPPAPTADGLGVRHLLRLSVGHGTSAWQGDVLYLRPSAPGRHPALAGLNFNGNHTTCMDPSIPLADFPVMEPSARGAQAGRWAFAKALSAGIGVATLCCSQVLTDSADPAVIDGHAGINRLFGVSFAARDAHGWGGIAAWAWALQRLVDLLEDRDDVDPTRIGVLGHSRLGKAALLATASDGRIAACIDNQSGTTGSAPSRKTPDAHDAESPAFIQKAFPHWFCPAFATLAAAPERLPIDQHHLLAACAPRPLLLATATEDRWADPAGVFRVARAAEEAWQAFGHPAALPERAPGVGVVVGDRLAWHRRDGKHGVLPEDWDVYLAFLARHWNANPP